MKLTRRAFTALACLSMATGGALAQDKYPTKPIRLIVPYAAGGSLDVVARAMQPKLSEGLGQPVVIENRGGASGAIGSDLVAKAPPDGYTIGLVSPATHSIPMALGKKLPYDPVKDFTPIALLVKNPLVVVVNASLPVHSLKELAEYGRKNPAALSYGTAGEGSTQHLEGVRFARLGGFEMVHVAYKGGSPALNDLLGGQIPVGFQQIPTVEQHVKAGALRALAVLDSERSSSLPEVPTAQEAWPGYKPMMSWIGAFAPAGTPAAIVQRLEQEMIRTLNDLEVRQKLDGNGQPVVAKGAQAMRAQLMEDIHIWGGIVRDAGLQIK